LLPPTATPEVKAATPAEATQAILDAAKAALEAGKVEVFKMKLEGVEGAYARVGVQLPPPSVIPHTVFLKQTSSVWTVILEGQEHTFTREQLQRLEIPQGLWTEEDFSAVTSR
jgi:hypothetical protein